MKGRLIFGTLILGVCLLLLAVSANLGVEANRAWKFGSLFGVAVIYFGSIWVRDRFFPPKNSVPDSGQAGLEKSAAASVETTGRYWSAWIMVAAAFALIGASLMLVMRVGAAMSDPEVTRLMFRVSAWGVLVVTAAISIASLPRTGADQFTQWWLPGCILLFFGFVATSRVPEIVSLIAGSPNAVKPNVATLLLVPIVVFAWRSVRLLKSRRPPRSD